MKKLLIGLTLSLSVVVANAAKIEWGSGTLYKNDATTGKFSTTEKIGSSATAYYFDLTKAVYDSLYASSYADTFNNVMAAYGSKLSTATATKGTSSLTHNVTLKSADYSTSAASTHYAALIYTYNDGTDDLYIANLAKGDIVVDQTGDTKIWDLGTALGGTGGEAIGGWQAVPEPFSGTLALLGMAGIALRRKLKKAKKA